MDKSVFTCCGTNPCSCKQSSSVEDLNAEMAELGYFPKLTTCADTCQVLTDLKQEHIEDGIKERDFRLNAIGERDHIIGQDKVHIAKLTRELNRTKLLAKWYRKSLLAISTCRHDEYDQMVYRALDALEVKLTDYTEEK